MQSNVIHVFKISYGGNPLNIITFMSKDVRLNWLLSLNLVYIYYAFRGEFEVNYVRF